MVRKEKPKTARKSGYAKLILTPSESVERSVHALEFPEEAQEVCSRCGLKESLLARYNASILHTHRRINAIVVQVPRKFNEPFKAALRRKGFEVTESKRVYPLLNETVPLLHVPVVWKTGFSGTSVTCAVLDTGIDQDHPDFAGRIQVYKNFHSESEEDFIGHGTHVAGIIGGAGNVYRGVAPEVKFVIAKVIGSDGGDDTDVLAGLSWSSRQNVEVMNLSLGGPGDPEDPVSRECGALAQEGFLLCVAAGNSGPDRSSIGSPANASGVITVGAVDKRKNLTQYSSRGPVPGKRYLKPDLVSFGGGIDFNSGCIYNDGIVSARSNRLVASLCDEKRLYTRMSGTSMATPHVSGIAVLLFDMLNRFASRWNRKRKARFIKKLLKESSIPLSDQKWTRWDVGSGFLDSAIALKKMLKMFSGSLSNSPQHF